MLVKIKARILIFPGTDFHFPSTSVPPGTFLALVAGTVVERLSLAGELSLSCARPAADG